MTIEDVMLISDNLIKELVITATYIKNPDNLNIISYTMNENVIEINYNEKIENEGEDAYIRFDSHYVSIFDYISFVHIYTMEKMEEKISNISR